MSMLILYSLIPFSNSQSCLSILSILELLTGDSSPTPRRYGIPPTLKARLPPIDFDPVDPFLVQDSRHHGRSFGTGVVGKKDRKKHPPESSVPEAPGKTTRETVSDAIDDFILCS